ncbi:hypothetical protein HP532_03000 [Pseudomonas sp. CrR25]|nr:hypothetical protein [Pseudomonas sp. CrR25]
MLSRALTALALPILLAACAGEPPARPQPPPAPVEREPAEAVPAPLPAHLRELSGSLLGIPSGAEVELALLTLDERGLPHGLLGNIQLRGDGAPLPFRLPFNPESFALGVRIELRGRAHQGGQLILRLPPLPIRHASSQAVGALRLVPAP